MTEINISEPVVEELGFQVLSVNPTSAIVPDDIQWDCAIGGIPFLFGFNDQNPMRRETADFRRQRIDSERNPGEQSLDSGMWIRSQASWHYGSGLSSAEPLEVSDTEAQFRYHDGGGVDPWTAGQLTLLNDTSLVFSSSAVASGHQLLGVTTGVLHSAGNKLTYITNAGVSASVNWGGTADILSMTTNGELWILSDDDGIYKGTLPNGTGSKIYNSKTSNDRTLVRWVKSRLMFAATNSIYEITNLSPSSATLPSALYDHPSANFVWTDFSEGPVAIYASGYDGDMSGIYSIGIAVTSSTVTLNQPVLVAEMPRGESVVSMYSYVGTYLVIGTTKGVRIATMGADGSLTMGPLIVETSDGSYDAVAIGSYVYVTVGSKGNAGNRVSRPGLYRIDLGTNLNNNPLVFASAADLVTPAAYGSGKANQVTVANGRLWFAVDGVGVFRQATTYVSSGWLETGRIRLGTIENKAWRDLRELSVAGMTGTITAYVSTSDSASPSNWSQVIQATGSKPDQVGKISSAIKTAQPNIYVAFNLATTNTAATPTFLGYQVRAIPAPRRTELISLPLLTFDYEVDRKGSRYGKLGNAFARYQALKQMEASASTVVFNDYTTGEQQEVFVEQVAYTRATPPTRSASGNGGLVTVLLRVVT